MVAFDIVTVVVVASGSVVVVVVVYLTSLRLPLVICHLVLCWLECLLTIHNKSLPRRMGALVSGKMKIQEPSMKTSKISKLSFQGCVHTCRTGLLDLFVCIFIGNVWFAAFLVSCLESTTIS